jgi:hypothetical protein
MNTNLTHDFGFTNFFTRRAFLSQLASAADRYMATGNARSVTTVLGCDLKRRIVANRGL